jgi:hypothetical protein
LDVDLNAENAKVEKLLLSELMQIKNFDPLFSPKIGLQKIIEYLISKVADKTKKTF